MRECVNKLTCVKKINALTALVAVSQAC